MSVTWYERAKLRIDQAHEALSPEISFKHRKMAIRNAYPFSEKRGFAYKAWLKAQREYLARHDPRPAGPLHAAMIESPLERAKRKSMQESSP